MRSREVALKVLYLLQGVDIQAIIDDIRKLKIIVKGHERRIKSLEEQLSVYESQQHRDSYWSPITDHRSQWAVNNRLS